MTTPDAEELSRRLLANERLTALGLLTAGIAHEVKNPLHFIANFAEISSELADELAGALPDPGQELTPETAADLGDILADLRDNLGRIVHHSRRADRIVHAMLDQASGRPSSRRPVDLNLLAEEAVALAYHGLRATEPGMNVSIDKALDPAMGMVEACPSDLTRAVLNLTNNACHATHRRRLAEGGAYAPRVALETRRLPHHAEIRLRDNGPGIPEGLRDSLFEPFRTDKPPGQGTGLGLVIARSVVEQLHGGTLTLERTGSEGTEFLISIPLAAPAERTGA